MDQQAAPYVPLTKSLSKTQDSRERADAFNNSLVIQRWWHTQQPDNFLGIKQVRQPLEPDAFVQAKASLPANQTPQRLGVPVMERSRAPKIYQ